MFSLIAEGLKGIFGTIDKLSDNKEKAEELKAQVETQVNALASKIAEFQSKVLQTEMTGSWMQRNWRPCLMFLFMSILADVYLFGAKIQMFFPAYKIATIPEQMWTLLTVGVGGYIGGRSFEKVVIKKGDTDGK